GCVVVIEKPEGLAVKPKEAFFGTNPEITFGLGEGTDSTARKPFFCQPDIVDILRDGAIRVERGSLRNQHRPEDHHHYEGHASPCSGLKAGTRTSQLPPPHHHEGAQSTTLDDTGSFEWFLCPVRGPRR